MKRSPKDNAISARLITRRGLILGGLQTAFVGALGFRMTQLQVEQADAFWLLAEENRINIRLLPPARGLIYDRDGLLIAENEQNYRIVIVREEAGDVEAVLHRLAELVPMTEAEIAETLDEINQRSPFVPVTIAERLAWEDVARVAVNAPALPGISPEVGLSRIYPVGPDFAHVVGYVGPVSDYDLQRIDDQDPLLQIPKFQIGKTGIENKLERRLRGAAGYTRIEVNAVGRVMRELDRQEGAPGADLQVTVDRGLQNYVQARLEPESASAIVMDLETGDILAMGSAPSFDPNEFVRWISVPDYAALLEDDHRPLANKAVQGAYPPGSTFKMITALTALDAGVITPDETIWCGGFIPKSGRRFHCWKRGGHGWMDLHNSMAQSCDIYYYDIAERVGIEAITAMAKRLGLGIRHDLPLSAVAEGLAPDKAWKRRAKGVDWYVGDTLNAGIGQGCVLASPLQLAVMTARLATGRSVSPRIIRSVNGIETASGAGTSLGLNENHLRLIRKSMFAVTNARRGTAWDSRIVDDALRYAGKTGTSQVRNITAAEREAGVTKNEDLPWERRDHALFVSYAPHEAPRIAVSVVVEHGGGGSTAAAPIARDIVLRALTGEMPPLEAYPTSQRRRIEDEQRALPLVSPGDDSDGSSRA